MRYAILVALLSICTPALANAPALPDNLSRGVTMPCTDNETGRRGVCTIYRDVDTATWVVFKINGWVEFVRYSEQGQPYITIWQRTTTY